MAIGTYHWRNSYRFISGFEFLRDYLKLSDPHLVSGWASPITNSPWRDRLNWWRDIERYIKLETPV